MNTYKLSENDSFQVTLEDLLDNQKDYPHLQIVLSRAGHIKNGIGKKYLMVTPTGFGIIKLLDLAFDGEYIILNLQDCTDGNQRHIPININDTSFKFLLIYWDNIKDIVMEEILTNNNKDDMLEIEF